MSVGIAAVLITILTALLSRSRAAAQSLTCLSRLHSISQGFTEYASGNSGQFPDPVSLQQSWEQCVNGASADPLIFACPADSEVFPVVGSSFDWRDTGALSTTMAGRSLRDTFRPGAVLAFETLPGWHRKSKMNAVMLDGSARTMNQEECLSDLQVPIRKSPGN